MPFHSQEKCKNCINFREQPGMRLGKCVSPAFRVEAMPFEYAGGVFNNQRGKFTPMLDKERPANSLYNANGYAPTPCPHYEETDMSNYPDNDMGCSRGTFYVECPECGHEYETRGDTDLGMTTAYDGCPECEREALIGDRSASHS